MTEESAAAHIAEIKALAAALRERRFRFALEGFGSGRNSTGMLESVPLDFVKIDGTLVQGLAGDPQLQQRVRLLVEAARKRSIQTMAERVEDANTMAVLWQVGVQYIQGYFVNEPEEVVLRAELPEAPARPLEATPRPRSKRVKLGVLLEPLVSRPSAPGADRCRSSRRRSTRGHG